MLDLTLYVAIRDYFSERERDDRAPFWLDATNDWAEAAGLTDDDLDYFLSGITRLAGHPWKGGTWEERPRNVDLDRLVWTFHRAWVDAYGPLYPRAS